MNKQEILSTTGLSESEFYKLYPTEESFKKKNPKMKLGGTLPRAQTGYSFNDPDAPKVTTPNSNVLAIQAQQAQAAKRQKERALYARDQYQDLQTHPQLSGVPRTKEELMEEAQRRATNKFALQDKPWSEIVPDVATDAALMMAPELLLGYGIPAMKNLWGAGLNSKAAKLLGKNPIGMTSVDPKFRGENAYKLWKDNKWIGDADFENEGGRYVMGNVYVEDAYRGQGLGKSAYIKSNQLLSEQGKGPLYSSGIFSGDDAKHVWGSLTKEGIAKQLGEDSWRFKQSPLKEFFGKYGNRGRLDKAAREDVLLDNTSDLEFENLMQGLGKKEKPPYVQTQEDLDLIEAIRNSPQRTEEEMREMLRGVQRRYDEENMEIPDVVKEQLSRLQFGKRPLETNAKPESFIQKDLADWQRIALENDNFGVSKNNLNKNFPDPYTGRDAWREDMSPNKFGGQPCPECLQKAQDGWTNDQRYLTDTGYAQTMDSLFNSYINPAFENSRNDLRNEKNPIPSNWWLQDNNNMLDAWKKAERYPAPRMTYPEMQEQWNKAERNPKPAKIVPYKTGGSHMMPDGSIMADSEHGSLYKAQDGWINPWQTPGASYPKDKYSQFNGMDESNFVHSTTPGSTRWVTKEGNRTPFQEMLLNYGNPIGPAFTGKDTLITRDPRRFDFKDGIADPDGWNTSESRDAGDQIRTKFYNMTYGSLGSLLTDKPDPLDQKYLDLSKQNQSVPQDIEKNLRLYSKAPSIKKTGGSVDQGIDSTSFLDDRVKKLIIHLKDTSQPAFNRTIQKEAFEEHQQQMQEMMSQFQGQQMDYGQQMPVQRFGGDIPMAQNGQFIPYDNNFNQWARQFPYGQRRDIRRDRRQLGEDWDPNSYNQNIGDFPDEDILNEDFTVDQEVPGQNWQPGTGDMSRRARRLTGSGNYGNINQRTNQFENQLGINNTQDNGLDYPNLTPAEQNRKNWEDQQKIWGPGAAYHPGIAWTNPSTQNNEKSGPSQYNQVMNAVNPQITTTPGIQPTGVAFPGGVPTSTSKFNPSKTFTLKPFSIPMGPGSDSPQGPNKIQYPIDFSNMGPQDNIPGPYKVDPNIPKVMGPGQPSTEPTKDGSEDSKTGKAGTTGMASKPFDWMGMVTMLNSGMLNMAQMAENKKMDQWRKSHNQALDTYAAKVPGNRGDYFHDPYQYTGSEFRPDQQMWRQQFGKEGGTVGSVVDMTKEELDQFIANGGEVEYL